jgi:hypothetical protein
MSGKAYLQSIRRPGRFPDRFQCLENPVILSAQLQFLNKNIIEAPIRPPYSRKHHAKTGKGTE